MGLEPMTFCTKGSSDLTTPGGTDGNRMVTRNRLRAVVRRSALSQDRAQLFVCHLTMGLERHLAERALDRDAARRTSAKRAPKGRHDRPGEEEVFENAYEVTDRPDVEPQVGRIVKETGSKPRGATPSADTLTL
jgi:hypothetical protein